MQLLDVLLVLAGLALLIAGGEVLVRGASALAERLGISPLVVGLVVVSAATSTPELAVTVGAILQNEPGLAVGNVVGSNIVNILLILGLCAIIVPLAVKRQLIRFDVPVMVGMSVLLLLLSLDGQISLVDGILLLAGLLVHTFLSVFIGRREAKTVAMMAAAPVAKIATANPASSPAPNPASTPAPTPALNPPAKPIALWLALVFIVAGVGLLVVGAQLLVDGAVSIAAGFGVSGLVIGLTVVAVGTSLPEVAASLAAVRRREGDIAVGNIVGSNIFNIGMVLGMPAILFAQGIPVPAPAIALDMPLMVAAAVALLPIAFTGFIIARWEGSLFVVLYIAYVVYLVLASTAHDALAGFSNVMLVFVLPLVGITLIVFAAYEFGLQRGKRQAREHPDAANSRDASS